MVSAPVRFKFQALFQVFLGFIFLLNSTQDSNVTTLGLSFGVPSISLTDHFEDKRTLCKCSRPEDIVGGNVAVEDMLSFAVFIEFMRPSETTPSKYVRYGRCGGTLVTDTHVLTAAACFVNFTLGHHTISSMGEVNVSDRSRKISMKSSKYVLHPEYDHTKSENDIALIEFETPLELGYDKSRRIITTMLPPRHFALKPGSLLTAIRWGQKYTNDPSTKENLQYVNFPLVQYDSCGKLNPVHRSKNFCAGGIPKEGVCFGDSGVGIFLPDGNRNYLLVGISSYVYSEFCGKREPSVFVNITEYVDWIYDNTMSASCAPCILDRSSIHGY